MPKVATASRNSDTIEADDHKVKFETTCDVVFTQKTGSWPKLHVPCGYYVSALKVPSMYSLCNINNVVIKV